LVLSVIPVGLGFLGVLFSENRRGWHDRIAGTEVVYTETAPKPAPWSSAGHADPEPGAA
jgi:uncharacterized RDD family membrane protein YckC